MINHETLDKGGGTDVKGLTSVGQNDVEREIKDPK